MIWRFLQANFVGTLTSGDLQYDFETNWNWPTGITLTAPDSNATHLDFIEYQQFRQRYPDPTAATESVPSLWTTRGRTFLIGPNPPDQTYTLDAAFERLPTTLTAEADTLDVPDDGSELIVGSSEIRVGELAGGQEDRHGRPGFTSQPPGYSEEPVYRRNPRRPGRGRAHGGEKWF
jgi:hypothetical protein